ncbi:unnamed protein product [Prorocentrum cordatum]|uniref:Subtilisin n=1 Tax=Prorocentrum cordatum TaxID=2364126 RepID=A0ABN9WR10_9DINO|nr:unnamed protein product [Polarella glacialis]
MVPQVINDNASTSASENGRSWQRALLLLSEGGCEVGADITGYNFGTGACARRLNELTTSRSSSGMRVSEDATWTSPAAELESDAICAEMLGGARAKAANTAWPPRPRSRPPAAHSAVRGCS